MSLTYDQQLPYFAVPVSERVDLSIQWFDARWPQLLWKLVEYIIINCPKDRSIIGLLRCAIRQHFGEKRIRDDLIPDYCKHILQIPMYSDDERWLLERIRSIYKLMEIQSHSR